MTTRARKALLWTPRILGIAISLFVGLFALDAVEEGIAAFLLHLTPTFLLLLVVAASWRWEWVGGAGFIVLALLYGVPAWSRWTALAAISGPLLLLGLLFLWSWRHHKELHARS